MGIASRIKSGTATLLAMTGVLDMRSDLPSWRSLLFVPVTAEKFVRTGADRGADGIILDLEDAVAPSEKERARALIADAIPQVSRNGGDVLVRVNRPWRLLV